MEIPDLIDLDAHLVEPPGVWADRLPRRYQDVGPRIEYMPAGEPTLLDAGYVEAPGTSGPLVPWWCYEDHRYSLKRLIAAAGYPTDEISIASVGFDDMRAGCWRQAERLQDMTMNGVEAQLCFPNYPRFAGQLFLRGQDRTLAQLCVQAYNDWMVEEWCAGTDGRLIPLCLLPLWDSTLAAHEVRRNAERGVRAAAFTELPAYLDLPSIHSRYWDPLFEACSETQTVLCMHIGSGTRTPQTSSDAPKAVPATIIFGNSISSMADFLFSGVLHRFPDLQLLYAEAQIGWIPYLLTRADDVWLTHRGWSESQRACPEPPSTYYYRQISSCFFKDSIGIELIDKVGRRNITFETDYPHQDGTWPHSRAAAAEQFGHLEDEIICDIARNNSIRLLHLDRLPTFSIVP